MESSQKTQNTYWNSFYENKKMGIEGIPSQFAAFVASELSDVNCLYDFGCGAGRDSFFFSRHLDKVVGVDGSASAVKFCEDKRNEQKINNIEFIKSDVSKIDDCNQLITHMLSQKGNKILYARFFLHAIDEMAEDNFLMIASRFIEQGGTVALEFRTNKDELLAKVTDSHYRRYINPMIFIQKAAAHNMHMTYFTEGFGYAKYKNDDAHVARFIFK